MAFAGLSFLTGVSGLIYEIAWARSLALILGSAAWAQALVLAAFLAGLAAGSAWLGAGAARSRRPLLKLAAVQAALAVWGLAGPAFFWAIERFAGGTGAALTRQILCAAVVAAPAVLMGGCLPLLCRAAESEGLKERVAALYSANCAGAAAGALATGYLLIPALGLSGSAYLAASVNILAALWALRLSADRRSAPASADGARTGAGGLLLGAMFFSGAAALAYETAWIRLLALVMGGSTYSFAAMLAAFIAGTAAGSWLVSRSFLARREAAGLFVFAQLGVAAAVLVTLPFYERLPYIFLLLSRRAPATDAGFYLLECGKFLLCSALMGAPVALLGSTMPLACRLAGARGESAGDVGRVYAANALGNVAGALLAAWSLPLLGLEGLIRAGVCLSGAVGLGFLAAQGRAAARRRLVPAAALLLAAALWAGRPPALDPLRLSLGTFRGRDLPVPPSFREFQEGLSAGRALLYHKDGRDATVAVVQESAARVLRVNGKADASSGGDMATQILLGQIPMALKPSARRGLVVGLGSGVTAGSLLSRPLASVDVFEISEPVVEAARFFERENGGALADRRTRLSVGDAKALLRRASGGYDVVVSEPSNPWMAGVGGLFSAEFYADVKAKLAPGGVMAQWLHTYEMDDEGFRLVLRTFLAAFPQASLWSVQGQDVILIGSQDELAPDFVLSEKAFGAPAAREDLARAGVNSLAVLLSRQIAGDAALRKMAGEGPLNTDERPRLEYQAPKAFFRNDTSGLVFAADERFDPATRAGLMLARYLKARGRGLSSPEYRDVLFFPHDSRERRYYQDLRVSWAREHPEEPEAATQLFLLRNAWGDLPAAAAALARLRALAPRDSRLPAFEKALRESRQRAASLGPLPKASRP